MIERFVKLLNGLFSKTDSKEESSRTGEESNRNNTLDEFKIIVKNNLPSELLSEVLGLNENINDQGKKFSQQGRRDGSIGITSMEQVKLRIKAIVTSITNPIKSSADGITRGLNKLLELKREEQITTKDEYRKKQEFADWLHHEYITNPRSFSRTIGWSYLVISLFLILADIPLALELTSDGLDLSIIPKSQGIEYLFKNFGEVVTSHWEVFILSIGIALCTVYIKIYYDEFLGRPLDKQVLYFKNLSENNKLKTEDIEGIKRTEKKRTMIKSVVLAISFLTIVSLGIFRYRTVLLSPETAVTPGRKELYELPGGIMVAIVFISLTILFPLIGGICASLGVNNIHNYKLLKRADKALEKARSKQEEFNIQMEGIIVKYNIWKSYLFRFLSFHEQSAWADGDIGRMYHSVDELSETEEEIRDYLIACYIQGYNEGLLNPIPLTSENDLFSKAQGLRNRIISQKSNSRLLERNRTFTSLNLDSNIENEID